VFRGLALRAFAEALFAGGRRSEVLGLSFLASRPRVALGGVCNRRRTRGIGTRGAGLPPAALRTRSRRRPRKQGCIGDRPRCNRAALQHSRTAVRATGELQRGVASEPAELPRAGLRHDGRAPQRLPRLHVG